MRKTVILAACAAMLAGCGQKVAETVDTRPLVRVGAVTNGVPFAEALAVQGTVRAKNVAALAARVPGTLDALLVEEGAAVKRGTPLFRIDRVNLGNAVRAAKDDLAMAKAQLAQRAATEAKARLDAARMARLAKEGAVTRDACERAEVAAKGGAAALEAARAAVTKAETGLSVAEKNFADSEVKAPFDGRVTKKHKNAGDFCSPGAKVFEMEDSACYEICCALNAAQYGRVAVGKTALEVTVPEGDVPAGGIRRTHDGGGRDEASCRRTLAVSYKSPSVDPLTRTFEIRAVIPKTSALAAGMLVDGRVIFARRTAQAVPAAAVAYRDGGDCVFKVVGGKVVRVPVVAGLSANGWREIVSPVFSAGDRLVTEGMLLVNEGDPVRTREGVGR